jgi:hypothetical protein
MVRRERIPQTEFDSLEEFFEGNNNYWNLFHRHSTWHYYAEEEQDYPFWDRFRSLYPSFSDSLINKVTRSVMTGDENFWQGNDISLWNGLWTAYKMMSQLIYKDDHEYEIRLTF